VIRRSVYLADDDDTVYKDDVDDTLELAFIRTEGNDYLFVEYATLDRVRAAVLKMATASGLTSLKPTSTGAGLDAQSPKAKLKAKVAKAQQQSKAVRRPRRWPGRSGRPTYDRTSCAPSAAGTACWGASSSLRREGSTRTTVMRSPRSSYLPTPWRP